MARLATSQRPTQVTYAPAIRQCVSRDTQTHCEVRFTRVLLVEWLTLPTLNLVIRITQ